MAEVRPRRASSGGWTKLILRRLGVTREETLDVPSDLSASRLLERLPQPSGANLSWRFRGLDLDALPQPLPARVALKEGFRRSNWTSWRHNAPAEASPPMKKTGEAQQWRSSSHPPDLALVCRGFQELRGDHWLYASSEVLGKAFSSFAWRRLVLAAGRRRDFQLAGEPVARGVQLRALQADLESIQLAQENLLADAGENELEAEESISWAWPFGEDSRREMELIFVSELSDGCGGANPSRADTLFNLGLLLLLRPSPPQEALRRAAEALERSLDLQPSVPAQQLWCRVRAALDADSAEAEEEQEELDPGADRTGKMQVEFATQRSAPDFEDMELRVEDSEEAPPEAGGSRGNQLGRSSTVEALTNVLDSLNCAPGELQASRRCSPAAVAARRLRQLWRTWLVSRHGSHLCRLRALPVLIHRRSGSYSPVPEISGPPVPALRLRHVEAMLHFASVPAEGLHETGESLCGVVWLLLYFGLRRGQGCFRELRRALDTCPAPACLGLVRYHGYCTGSRLAQDPARNLEDVLLHGLSATRGDELAQVRGFASAYSDLDTGGLSEEDQLAIWERRCRLLEQLMGTPPKAYLPAGHELGAQTLTRPSAHRGPGSSVSKAVRYDSGLHPQLARRTTAAELTESDWT